MVCVEELGPPTVEIAQGIVDGIWGTSRTKERKYAAFHMVPYGKAERFEVSLNLFLEFCSNFSNNFDKIFE